MIMVVTTFDGPMYADVGQDLIRSSKYILTIIICRGIHVQQRRTLQHIQIPQLLASNVTNVMRNAAILMLGDFIQTLFQSP